MPQGAFGVVLKGTYNRSPVAIKKIKMNDDEDAFEYEVKQMVVLRHPNIVQFMGVARRDDYKFIVMVTDNNTRIQTNSQCNITGTHGRR